MLSCKSSGTEHRKPVEEHAGRGHSGIALDDVCPFEHMGSSIDHWQSLCFPLWEKHIMFIPVYSFVMVSYPI